MQPSGKPGAGHQASSDKQQAALAIPATNCRASIWRIDMRFKLINYNCSPGESWGCGILPRVTMSQEKAESCKRQASSSKPQAASVKQGWFESFWGEKGATNCRASLCHKDSRCKRQASSPKQQASSCKPRAASSLIFFPS
jgi:hypothetical protein